MFKNSMRASVAALCWLFGTDLPAPAQDNSVDALVRAYPDFLLSHDAKVLTWKDGTQMLLSDGRSDKSFEEKLRHAASIRRARSTWSSELWPRKMLKHGRRQ
jgi:hypothetical protein